MNTDQTLDLRSMLLEETEKLCQKEKNIIIENYSADIDELGSRLQFLSYKQTILWNQAVMENPKLLERVQDKLNDDEAQQLIEDLVKRYTQNFEKHISSMNIHYKDFYYWEIHHVLNKLYPTINIKLNIEGYSAKL